MPVLAAARGFRVGEIEIQHRPRRHGSSKYGVSRILKGALDLLTVKFLTGFGQRPQHLLGAVGLASFVLGALGMVYLALYWVAGQWHPELGLLPLHVRPAMYYSVGLLILGGQLVSVGMLAELLVAYHNPDQTAYSIAERTPAAESPLPSNPPQKILP